MPFEAIANPMTWYADSTTGTTVSVAGSWATTGTQVELIASAPFDMAIAQVLANPLSHPGAEAQFNFWKGASGTIPFGAISAAQAGINGDGYGPGTMEFFVPLGTLSAGDRLAVSGSRGNAGNANWAVSVGMLPTSVTGTLTFTTALSKVAPNFADGISIAPADFNFTPGAWVQLLAAAGGDMVIQNLIVKMPGNMAKSSFKIDIGTGGVGAEAVVDSFMGGSGNTAVALEGSPFIVYSGLPARGLIALGDRVSLRIGVFPHRPGPTLAAWTVHAVYFDL